MKRIQTSISVTTVQVAAWLLVWPTLVFAALVFSVKFCVAWYGDELGQFPFPFVFPGFFVPFLALLVASTLACWLVPRSLCVPLDESVDGGWLQAALILVGVLAAVIGVWWWILTETS
jgi:hypothetical protein